MSEVHPIFRLRAAAMPIEGTAAAPTPVRTAMLKSRREIVVVMVVMLVLGRRLVICSNQTPGLLRT
jgi:hypothetical protein